MAMAIAIAQSDEFPNQIIQPQIQPPMLLFVIPKYTLRSTLQSSCSESNQPPSDLNDNSQSTISYSHAQPFIPPS